VGLGVVAWLAVPLGDVMEEPFLDFVFDGPPGPEGGRFVEVENDRGESVRIGEWLQRDDGYWVLRVGIDE
jgi:hypothetical protein